MRCVSCDTELIPGKQFCHACGTRVLRTCASCGETVEAGYRFCPQCGAATADDAPAAASSGEDRLHRLSENIPDVLAEKIRASQGAIAGERKLVTVLFCDLVGSTAIAERLDPEEYRDLLEQYMAIAFREIYKVEGIVNRLAGDGLMALFGAPIAHEDAPHRAVSAALEIRDAFASLATTVRAQSGVELALRIGIHSGPVVVGTVGNDLKMDYTAIGDTTNLASRLESVAQPGPIVMSEATHRLVRGFFEVRPIGPFEVKGKRDAVTAHEVLGRTERTSPMAIAEARGLTPLVARAAEVSQLAACFDRLADGLPQVVAVVGEAGSGKSRLIYELTQSLVGTPATIFEARCSALSQAVPYAPWVSMLRQYFGVGYADAPAEAQAKVAERVRAWDPGLDQMYPMLCHILDVPVEGENAPEGELKQETFGAVERLVGLMAADHPVVMAIEDLHWIDEPSREMLEMAVAHIRRSRIMLVVSHRPDYQASWKAHAAFTQLNLRPLTDGEAPEIIRAVAGGPLPPELERRIVEKAEGNPFFLEEITRALVEEGYLLRSDGRVRLTRPVAEMRIPGTVEEVIGARLDRLGAAAKRVVQVASVLGRQFRSDKLTVLLAGEHIDVKAELEALERRGIIHRKTTALSHDEFRFGESLTQDVAYEGLLLKQRRELHERIGTLIDAAPGERSGERLALLAHHFVRSENRTKAVEALVHAGREAERVPAYRAAADHYRQAWELAEPMLAGATAPSDAFVRLAFEAVHGFCRMVVIYGIESGDDPTIIARRGRELAERYGDLETLAVVESFHGMMMTSGDPEQFKQGVALVENALAIARRANLALPKLTIARALSWVYLFDGRLELASVVSGETLSELERAGQANTDVYFGARWMRDLMLVWRDDYDAAVEAALETRAAAIAAGNRTVQSGAAVMLAEIHLIRGQAREAREWSDQALEIARSISNVSGLRLGSAIGLLARLDLGESVAFGRYVDTLDSTLSTGGNMALGIRVVVEAYLAAGENKRAERAARFAYLKAGGRLREMLCSVAMGDVMLAGGAERWDDAERWYERARGLAGEIGHRSTAAIASLGLAEIAASRGDRETALRLLNEGLEGARTLGLVREQRRGERLEVEITADAQQRA